MGVDFNRISFGISSGTSRTGFGSIVSFPSGPSFPAAGTITGYTGLQEYPIVNGGTYFSNPLGGGSVPNQNATFAIRADGSGGTYTDFGTTGTVSYKPPGIFATDTSSPTVLYINIDGTDYYGGESYPAYSHDGSGSYNSTTNNIWLAYGTSVHGVSIQTEIPGGSGNYYDNGTYTSFRSDGSGGWYSVTAGSFYANGIDTGLTGLDSNTQIEVPSGSGNYYWNGEINGYFWNGSGGFYIGIKMAQAGNGSSLNLSGLDVPDTIEVPVSSGNYYPTGEIYGYTWNGASGYNSGVQKGTRYSNGTLIWESIAGSSGSVEVPSGSAAYHDYQYTGDRYTILDNSYSPPYAYASSWNKPNGTFIFEYNFDNYYWDGSGGYYSVPV